jgi:hypothetical protein
LQVNAPPDMCNLVQRGLADGNRGPLTAALVPDGNPAAAGRYLQLNPDGSFHYAPPDRYSGMDWFTYKLEDREHDASQYATVFIRIRPLAVSLSMDDHKPGEPAILPQLGEFNENGSHRVSCATMHLNLPTDLPQGTQVTVSVNEVVLSKLRVYEGMPGIKGSRVVVGTKAGASHTWTVGDGKDPVPAALYAIGLSPTEKNQVVFTISVLLPVQMDHGHDRRPNPR